MGFTEKLFMLSIAYQWRNKRGGQPRAAPARAERAVLRAVRVAGSSNY